MKSHKGKAREKRGGCCVQRRVGLTGRRYNSVREMLIGENMPKKVVRRFDALVKRDEQIASQFAHGASMKRLSRKHSLPLLAIEDIIRFEMLTRSQPNA